MPIFDNKFISFFMDLFEFTRISTMMKIDNIQ